MDTKFIRMSSTDVFDSLEPGVDARDFVCRVCKSRFRVACIHVDSERSLLFASLSNGGVTLYDLEQCTQITKFYHFGIGEFTPLFFFFNF